MKEQYCKVCGKQLNDLELLCGMDTCFDCVDTDEDLSATADYTPYNPSEDGEDILVYYINDCDDYKELDFN